MKYEIGLAVDLDSANFPDLIYTYYQNLDWKKFKLGCDTFIQKANNDQHLLSTYLEKILSK